MIPRHVWMRDVKPGDQLINEITGEPWFTVHAVYPARARGYVVIRGEATDTRWQDCPNGQVSGRALTDVRVVRT